MVLFSNVFMCFFSPRPTAKGTKGPNYCQPNAAFELDVIEVCEAITILIQNKPNMYMWCVSYGSTLNPSELDTEAGCRMDKPDA